MQITKLFSNLFQRIAKSKPIEKLAQFFGVKKTQDAREIKIWERQGLKETKSYKNFKEFQLANGLKVVFKKSKGNSLRSSLLIKSGAMHDPQNKSGLAHLLEHLVLGNTKEFSDDLMDLVKYYGGSVNGGTSRDATSYEVSLGVDKLDLALRILAGVFDQRKISQVDLEHEKSIIAAEILRVHSKPGFKLTEKILSLLYGKGHPMATNLTGSVNSLDSISIADLEQFYSKQYLPNNATLVISGDFKEEELKRLLIQHFVKFKSDANFENIDFAKTKKPSSEKEHVFRDKTLTPSINYLFQSNLLEPRKRVILAMIIHALKRPSSRLHKKLIDGNNDLGKQIALAVSMVPVHMQGDSLIELAAVPVKSEDIDQKFETIEKAFRDELENIAANGLRDKELDLARKVLEADEIYSEDRPHSDISEIYTYDLLGNDWRDSQKMVELVKSITNEEIKEFAREYLDLAKVRKIKVYGEGNDLDSAFLEQAGVNDDHKRREIKAINNETINRFKSLGAKGQGAKLNLTGVDNFNGPVGMKVSFKHDPSLPVVFVSINCPGGSLAETKDQEAMTGIINMLIDQTGSYNPETGERINKKDLDDVKSRLGISVHRNSSYDNHGIGLSTLSSNINESIKIMRDVFKYPALLETDNPDVCADVEREFRIIRKTMLDGINQYEKQAAKKANIAYAASLYPEGHNFHERDFDELKRILRSYTVEDMRKFYRKNFSAKNAQVCVVGDVTKKDVQTKLLPLLARWNPDAHHTAAELDYSKIAPVAASGKTQVKVIQSEDNRPESTVFLGNTIDVKVDDPDYLALRIASRIIGGSLNSRLFRILREQEGLVYHIESSAQAIRNGAGPFTVHFGCDPLKAKKALSLVVKELNDLLKNGVTQAELDLEKSNLENIIRNHAVNTRANTCGKLAELLLRGKDHNFYNTATDRIAAVSLLDVNNVIKKMIKPESYSIVLTKPKDYQANLASKARFETEGSKSQQTLAA